VGDWRGNGQRTHDIHAGKLGPYLGEDTDVGSVDHVGFEEFEESSVGVLALKLAHIFDVSELMDDERAVGVAFTVYQRKNSVTFLPAVLASEPSWRLRKEAHSDEK